MTSSNLLLIVLLVLFSLSATSVYSLSAKDAVTKQDDQQSYFLATSGQGSVLIDVEELAKARSLQALVAGSKVVVNKAVSRSARRHRSPQVGSLQISALVGIIIAAIVVTIVIICVLYYFYRRHERKKILGHGQSLVTEKE